uniref:Uncharacterized protein n=1 Tax=Ananas comosus var. bracteatus TaxID=296719 RepID=A0A6V7PL47_ANACO|nr:unnamed protein product [Ananas comosus var. bracteatus]
MRNDHEADGSSPFPWLKSKIERPITAEPEEKVTRREPEEKIASLETIIKRDRWPPKEREARMESGSSAETTKESNEKKQKIQEKSANEGSSDWPCSELSRFSGGSLTVFRPMARVPRFAACTGTRLCLYRYKVDGCTGTAIGACTGTEPQSPATRASGLDFVDLVPVQEPVYRYKGADFVQFELQGAFCDCGLLISIPHAQGVFF